MDWLNYLILTQFDPNKHTGIPNRWNPMNLPEHADPGPADIPNIFWFLGPNVVGNYIMAAILLCAVLFGVAPRVFTVLIVALIVGGIAIAASGKYGYF